MRRMAFAVATLLAWCASPVRADTLPLIEGVPGTYTPGTPFTFEVRVPQLADFTSYTVELIFTTDSSDQLLGASATKATSMYPFPTPNHFTSAAEFDEDAAQLHLQFSDFTSPGVLAKPGVNNWLATVTVTPDATLRGPITIELGPATDFQHSREDPRYLPPQPLVVEQADLNPAPVPAPPGALLLGAGVVLLAARSRLTRRAD